MGEGVAVGEGVGVGEALGVGEGVGVGVGAAAIAMVTEAVVQPYEFVAVIV